MEVSSTLFQLSCDMAAIEDALWENGGELTPELERALTETEQSLATKVDGYNRIIRSFASKSSIIDEEIKRLTALKKTADNAEKRLKKHILDTMLLFNIEKLEGAYCKISKRKTQKIETNDEILIDAYQRNIEELSKLLPPYITLDVKVSKTALKEFQKAEGLLPAGAEVVDNYSLLIK